MKYDPKDVGFRMKYYRKKVNRTQVEMADALLMSRSSYIALERGKKHLKLQEAIRATNLFGCSLDDLLITK